MTKKIKKRSNGDNGVSFIVKCDPLGEELWFVAKRLVGNDGLPVMEYCKEVCLFRCGDNSSTIQRLDP